MSNSYLASVAWVYLRICHVQMEIPLLLKPLCSIASIADEGPAATDGRLREEQSGEGNTDLAPSLPDGLPSHTGKGQSTFSIRIQLGRKSHFLL